MLSPLLSSLCHPCLTSFHPDVRKELTSRGERKRKDNDGNMDEASYIMEVPSYSPNSNHDVIDGE